MATLKTKIVLRNDVAEQWMLNNPTLLAGEAGYEKDTGLLKIGDGQSAWNDLPYVNDFQATEGDEQAIHLNPEDGVLTLVNWNEKYFKWDSETQNYIETEGWRNGLEPKVGPDGKLAWYEPNPSTLEGLESAIAALQTADAQHTQKIAAIEANYLPLTGGALTGDLVLADGAKAISSDEADVKIAAAVQNANHLKREIVEELPLIENADVNTIYMVPKDIDEAGNNYSEWMVINGIFEQIGDTSADLTNYVEKVSNATVGNIAALLTDGSLQDAGIAALEVKEHLANENIHILEVERAQWNAAAEQADANAESISALMNAAQLKKYEFVNVPAGFSIRYTDTEIRVMAPKDFAWQKQAVGAQGNANMYYLGFRAYAPDNAVYFKEGDQGVIEDTIFDFNDSFAGTDEYGRKYSIVWLAMASYDEASDTWTYFGTQSSTARYVGWTYAVEWYDENHTLITSDVIRINLSNEDCHLAAKPYYMGSVLSGIKLNNTLVETVDQIALIDTADLIKESEEIGINEDGSLSIKSISFSKLIVDEGEEIILGGGGSSF